MPGDEGRRRAGSAIGMQFADAPQPERYVVLRALGKGSFGTVDLVRDLQDGGRLLALKTVRLPIAV